ncbi:hypothetical protein [Thalassomonas actiniarum]|uniref:Uncharacterized protein n=1 Tax=Thalassomonas actiniarum TaxID=485447 RepID=A0AAE9YRN7_9GAMM|nr:hypothetical protein [Thalassomonas actiniarum]WDD99193.1 hypothetical protein SG35_000440 [Thalassomonas actiniarum]
MHPFSLEKINVRAVSGGVSNSTNVFDGPITWGINEGGDSPFIPFPEIGRQ